MPRNGPLPCVHHPREKCHSRVPAAPTLTRRLPTILSHCAQNICITFIQRWTNVEDVGPTLYKCYANVLCLLGCLTRCWTLRCQKTPLSASIFHPNVRRVRWSSGLSSRGEPTRMSARFSGHNRILKWRFLAAPYLSCGIYFFPFCIVNDEATAVTAVQS